MFNTVCKKRKAYFNANTKIDKYIEFLFFNMYSDEIWKSTRYKYYYVSNHGRVISLYNNKPRILKRFKSGKYFAVCIESKKIRIHRLVAETFISNHDKDKTIVHHKDGNKHNNFVDNLEWISYREHNKLHSKNRKKNKCKEVKKNG